jgi:ribosomal protein S18 acetylase RimI-like enzyme
MNVTYRDAMPDDAPALAELFAQSFVDTFGHLYRPDDLAQFLAANTEAAWRGELDDAEVAMRVAERDGELIGFADVGPKKLPFDAREPVVELRRLYLRKDAHGSGVAHRLMDWVLEEAARRGARELLLSVYVDNHRARRFYERYGFETVGRYDFMVGNHADDDLILRHVVMQATP